MYDDKNLQAIVKELGNHMDSIQGNTIQIKGIGQAMTKSKAAVQVTLSDRLEDGQCRDVVLG